MNQRSTSTIPVQFRGIRERTLDDQMQAIGEGYSSIEQMAIDELARRLIELEQRVAVLEGGELEPVEGQG